MIVLDVFTVVFAGIGAAGGLLTIWDYAGTDRGKIEVSATEGDHRLNREATIFFQVHGPGVVYDLTVETGLARFNGPQLRIPRVDSSAGLIRWEFSAPAQPCCVPVRVSWKKGAQRWRLRRSKVFHIRFVDTVA